MPLADARGPASAAVDVRWSMADSWSVATTLARGGDVVEVQLDAQTEALQLAVAIPWRRFSGSALAERLATAVEARAIATWGGWSDGGIERWHRRVGTVNFDRDACPRDCVAVRLAEVGGPRLLDARSGRQQERERPDAREDRLSSPLFEGGWTLANAPDDPSASACCSLLRAHNRVGVGMRWGELTARLSEDFTPGGRLAADGGPGWFHESNSPDVVLGLAWGRAL